MADKPAFELSESTSHRSCACDRNPSAVSCYACSKIQRSSFGQKQRETETLNHQTSSAINISSLRRMRVAPPGDHLEKEADRVAKEIVKRPEVDRVKPIIQRATLATAGESENHSEESLTSRSDIPEVSAETESHIQRTLGKGRPLPGELRKFFESRFDHDLTQVRIHTDHTAASTSRNLNAAAFTVGSDIFFNAGHFNPNTPTGVGLIAHELTHAVQQGADSVLRQVIHRDELAHHALVWGDFRGQPVANASEGAGIWSSFRVPTPSLSPSVKDTKKKCTLAQPVGKRKTDTTFAGTASVNPVQFDSEFQPYMDTDQSWALAQIKDNGVAYCAAQVARCEQDFDQNPRSNIRLGSATATSKADCSRRFKTACLSDRKAESDRLLAHEQGHFDITKVMSDKARDSVKAAAAALTFTSSECGPTAAMDALETASQQPRQDLKDLGERWRVLKNTVQDEYDLKTTHGINARKQQEWEGKIRAKLVDFNVPSTAPVTAPATTPTVNPPAPNAPRQQRTPPASTTK